MRRTRARPAGSRPPARRLRLASHGTLRACEPTSSEVPHVSRTIWIMHQGLQRLRCSLRSLRDQLPGRAGRRHAAGLHPSRPRLCRDLSACDAAHGERQPLRPSSLCDVRCHLRGLRSGVRKARDRPLPRVCQGVSFLRRRMPPHGGGLVAGANRAGVALRGA
jgi:hypothetical protein